MLKNKIFKKSLRIPRVAFIRWATAIPLGTVGSLRRLADGASSVQVDVLNA